jgi:hypothetical protein
MAFNPSSAVYQPTANCPLSEATLLSTPKGTILTKTGSPAVRWFITELSPKGCSVWRPVLKDSPQETGMKDASGKVYSYAVQRNQKKQDVAYLNVDHTFEIKFLKECFLEIMRQDLTP